jgi:hypothetical protein
MDTDSGIFIQQGDAWQPESASRHNAVNDMLCSLGTVGPAAAQTYSGGTGASIIGRNVSDKTISAGSYVTISYREYSADNLYADTYRIMPGTAGPCGVVSEDCPPGETVDVWISGIVQARIFPAPPDVMVIPGVFQQGMQLVNLNSIGSDIYRNYFKVSAVGVDENGYITKIRIFDGADPESGIAGPTDTGDVYAAEIEHTFTAGTNIYLRLKVGTRADGTACFTHEFEVNAVENLQEPMLCLAEIGRENKIIQRWTGGKIYWRDRFVIPFLRG